MGKGGDASVNHTKFVEPRKNAGNELVNEVLIHNRWYDVKEFKHPGGRVLTIYDGEDATQAFDEFHIRSQKAQKYLKSLPSREAKEAETAAARDPLVKDFDVLREELKEEGFFDPSPSHVAARCIEILALHALGFFLWHLGGVALKIAGVVVLGVAQGRCGWLMHEGGHYSLTGQIKLDRLLQVVLYGVGCGMSGSWWRNQHNKHHAAPQRVGADPDLNTMPLVAFTRAAFGKVKGGKRWWVQNQARLFVPVINPLVALGWQFFLHPKHALRTQNGPEILALAVRFAGIAALCSAHGVLNGWMLYLAYNFVASNYIFLNFAVSHTHLPTVPKGMGTDWVRYAAVHTMNVGSGPMRFVDWWMSYLNYQIEHHLFPSMPQFRHPIVSKRVRAVFEKHGVRYDTRGYFESMAVTFRNLHHVGEQVDADMFVG